MVAEAAVIPFEDVRERRRTLPARIPSESEFTSEFLASAHLDDLAQELIEQYDELEHLQEVRIRVCWKQKGGAKAGKSVLGKCSKPSGLLLFFSELDFVIWLAADHCRDWNFTNHQLEALVYHELCHAGVEFDDDDQPKYGLLPHDVEMFTSELDRYGLWMDDLKRAKHAFDQVTLPGFGS